MRRSEDEWIRLIRQAADNPAASSIRVGIGDDCAALAPLEADQELLLTTDQIIEGTHFIRDLHPPGALGRKTLARGLSDIAAMGGRPSWFLLSVCLPNDAADSWLKHYLDGMFLSIKTFDAPYGNLVLVGGDLARGERFAAHVVVGGAVPRGEALLRGGARAGDRIFVSGELGGSALGLERLLSRKADPEDPAVERHLNPTPRLRLGERLRSERIATAAMDLSDGVSSDLARMAEASGLAARIDPERIPRFAGASPEQALHGGEEYELLFAADEKTEVSGELDGPRLTEIGRFEQGEGVWTDERSGRRRIEPAGFEHFGPRQAG